MPNQESVKPVVNEKKTYNACGMWTQCAYYPVLCSACSRSPRKTDYFKQRSLPEILKNKVRKMSKKEAEKYLKHIKDFIK